MRSFLITIIINNFYLPMSFSSLGLLSLRSSIPSRALLPKPFRSKLDCHLTLFGGILESLFYQSLSNNSRCESFGFFNALRFTKVNFRHLFALKKPVTFVTGFAERKGFEPSIRCRIHAFQACSLNHSDTSLIGLQM